MAPFGPVDILDEADSRALWHSVRDGQAVRAEAARARPLWRISVPPARGPRIVGGHHAGGADVLRLGRRADLGGHALCREPDAASCAAPSRGIGGHATLIRAPAAVRAAVEVFQPEPAGARRGRQAREGKLRPQGPAQSRAHVGGGVRCCRLSGHARPGSPSAFMSQEARAQARPCGWTASLSMQTNFTLRNSPIRRSRIGKDPARLRALRLLHRHLSDLCAARRRTRFSPRGRIYLIKEMLEQDRPATARRGQAYRPLPVVPVLHDHLPVGRQLHAPGRPRARAHREDLQAPARPAAHRSDRWRCRSRNARRRAGFFPIP